jgi:Zn-dependent protease
VLGALYLEAGLDAVRKPSGAWRAGRAQDDGTLRACDSGRSGDGASRCRRCPPTICWSSRSSCGTPPTACSSSTSDRSGAGDRLPRRAQTEPARAVETLLERFGAFGYTPFLKAERGGGVAVQAWPLGDMTQAPRPRLALALFALTVLSTFAAGWAFFTGSETFDALRALPFPGSLLSGAPFALTLLAILGVHEFGHYFTARYYGAAVSLPYFIPAPVLFGTFGAIIRMRSPARDRNSLFDIAAAGPLAGLLVALPALLLGLAWSRVVPAEHAGLGGFGYSLLTRLFVWWRFGDLPPARP